jgi:hypothetical protein
VGDVDDFVEWLRETGTPEPHVAAHRHYAEELAKHPSLSAALRYHEDAGAPPQRIANLKSTAVKRAEFEQAREAPRRPQLEPRLEVERPAPRAREVTANPRFSTPRAGCECKKRYDLYLDNDFGTLAKMLGGGIGLGTFLLIRMIGVVGALAIALGLAGLGGFATIMTVCFRCEGCRKPIKDLDDEERSTLRKGRAMVVLVTAALWGGAALCVFLWLTAVRSHRGY